ncbi:MAG: Protein YgiW [Desulfovibrio sp.]
MRRLILLCFLLTFIASPAWAAFKGPSATPTPAVTSALEATNSPEKTTCTLTGNITQHLTKDRYTFTDSSGTITVNIPPHVFGSLNVAPENTVKLTGEIRGKKNPNHPDTHLGVRYIEILK